MPTTSVFENSGVGAMAVASEEEVFLMRGNRSVKLRHKMMAAGASGLRASTADGRSIDPYEPLHTPRSGSAPRQTVRRTVVATDDLKEQSAGSRLQAFREQVSILTDIFSGRINLLLIFVPIGQVCSHLGMDSVVIFSTNFLAIVPLASLLGSATEALSAHTGQSIGGLLNATFGNAVEMIMCIQSVKAGLISVVQGNLLGSILSNLLLVLGMALVASGFKRRTASFNAQGAAANMTCQLVASISVCLPTVFDTVHGATSEEVLEISRICSLLLMTLYGLFLYFMLRTHTDLFADEGAEEEVEQGLSPSWSVALLLVSTLLVERCSDALVGCIEDFSEGYGVSKAFIGVILLPIVGNAAEHATAVTAAYHGMIDLALGVAVGSSTQIALFVVPVAVLFGWIYDKPMDLNFTIFDTACQMLTVFLVSQVLQHGSINWLHGVMLMSVYCFIAIETLYIMDPEV